MEMQRLAALELQLGDLLRWKDLFVSSLGLAAAVNPNLFHGMQSSLPQYAQVSFQQPSYAELKSRNSTLTAPQMPPTPPESVGDVNEAKAIAAPTKDSSADEEAAQSVIAGKVLDIIQSYGKHLGNEQNESGETEWVGRKKFTPKVMHWVKQGVAVRMIIPAFPWKSVNRMEKVIGALPDFGEELALARLDALCRHIQKVYPPGAQVHIATDGLVFNDLLGISDEDTWNYSVELMRMAASKGFHSIKITRVMDVLGLVDESQEMTKELYMSTVTEARKQLEAQFGDAYRDVRKLMKDDEDTMLTYCGFIRFLRTDLRYSTVAAHAKTSGDYRRVTKEVAMGMMMRAESFTKIILAHRGDYVRLSVHPSSGAVKLSIPLVPQRGEDGWPRTPWHCAIAVGVGGAYKTVHAQDLQSSHNLIYRDGRPYFFREKSPLYDWEEDVVEFEHLYPQGLVARAKVGVVGGEKPVLKQKNLGRLRSLAKIQGGEVRVEGFAGVEDGVVSGE